MSRRWPMKARLNALTDALYGAIVQLKPCQRGAARRALNKLTSASCSWTLYEMRGVLHEYLDMAGTGRTRKRRAVKP